MTVPLQRFKGGQAFGGTARDAVPDGSPGNITVQGFESFVMEYDYTQFNKRMRVVRQELPRPQQPIMMVGSNTSAVGVPDVRAKVHYIRPDGNSDQYRKGGPI